jgi:hypothetical protein
MKRNVMFAVKKVLLNSGGLKSVGVEQPLAVNISVNEVFVGGRGEKGGTPTETHPTSDIAPELS